MPNEINLPHIAPGSSQPSAYTQMELAELTASKRNIIIYERYIDDQKDHIKRLQAHNEELASTISSITTQIGDVSELNSNIAQLKRAKIEMYVQFVFATIMVGIGGGLISTYPMANGNIPWQFSLGWGLICVGLIFGTISRPIVWLVQYKLSK